MRAGLRDAREERPAFLWTVLTDKNSRREFLRSGWRDISKIFVIAMILDAIYQAIVFHRFFVIQAMKPDDAPEGFVRLQFNLMFPAQ